MNKNQKAVLAILVPVIAIIFILNNAISQEDIFLISRMSFSSFLGFLFIKKNWRCMDNFFSYYNCF